MEMTLVVSNDELSELYHIIKKAKVGAGGYRKDLYASWMTEFSRAYHTCPRHSLTFKGYEYDILFAAVKWYISQTGGDETSRNLWYFFMDQSPDSSKWLEQMDRGDRNTFEHIMKIRVTPEQEERRAREQEERLRVELEQHREEQRLREEREREARELEQRAQAGQAWDTNVENVSVWSTEDDESDLPTW